MRSSCDAADESGDAARCYRVYAGGRLMWKCFVRQIKKKIGERALSFTDDDAFLPFGPI